MKENNNEIIDTNELIPGVMLIKELKKVENISGSEIIGILIYKIKLERMNILNLDYIETLVFRYKISYILKIWELLKTMIRIMLF